MSLTASQRALLHLYLDAGRTGVSCFDVGNAVWPDREGRIAANGGGGDYAAQMLLGRLKKAGLVEHAPSTGSSLWRLSQKGLEAVRELVDRRQEEEAKAYKAPIDLAAEVQARLGKLAFLAPVRVEDISEDECVALGEGTSANYTRGVKLNGSVGIFLNHWGSWKPHNRFSFAVFEQVEGSWSLVCSRLDDIEGLDEAIPTAVRTLAEHALRPTEVRA
ncbi:MAG TPA: hypothetical protein VLE97_06440 [Gaiellaceae bacterium]|nr:hypothetical protein [Gaiellaceae bacterium]